MQDSVKDHVVTTLAHRLQPKQQDTQKVQYKTRTEKRQKSDSGPDQLPRNFWDSLSRVWLAPDAIREFNRRNALLFAKPSHQVSEFERQVLPRDIVQFARHGGPDLADLRQYLPSGGGRGSSAEMNSFETEMKQGSSTYTSNFGQLLIDNGISGFTREKKAANAEEWDKILMQPRPSLSPSRFSDSHYDDYVAEVDNADNKSDIMSFVFQNIKGKRRYPSRHNAQLRNLVPLINNIVIPQPDYYEGEQPGPGNRQLRRQLDKFIVPSSHENYPFLPNFFLKANALDGDLSKAEHQACHAGALGARAMHRVENLGRRREVFDSKARTASAILHGRGTISLFAHHLRKPTQLGGPVRTFMNPIGKTYNLGDNPKRSREGVGAFRNASDFANQHRRESIENAHRRSGIVTP